MYICNKDFCLYKTFEIILNDIIINELNGLILNNQIQKRVDNQFYPEKILNYTIPNKKGITISTNYIVQYAPKLIDYYQNDLCKLVSYKINLKLFPTDLDLPIQLHVLFYTF